MKDSKLILVDGLTGSGKSTSAHFLTSQLQRNGISARWYWEGDMDYPIRPIRHDRLDTDELRRTNLEDWRALVDRVKESGEVTIVEAAIFQNTLRYLLQGDLPSREIVLHAHDVQAILADVKPIAVYFSQADVAAALRKVCDARGRRWERGLVHYFTSSPRAKARGLKGFEGMVAFLQEYRELTDRVFETLEIPKLSIDTSPGDWRSYRRRMCDFLEITQMADGHVAPQRPEDFAGYYRDRRTHGNIEVVLGPDRQLEVVRLLPAITKLRGEGSNIFWVEGTNVRLEFVEEPPGSISGVQVGGAWSWKFDGRTLLKLDGPPGRFTTLVDTLISRARTLLVRISRR